LDQLALDCERESTRDCDINTFTFSHNDCDFPVALARREATSKLRSLPCGGAKYRRREPGGARPALGEEVAHVKPKRREDRLCRAPTKTM
jgi:hypothetical protein